MVLVLVLLPALAPSIGGAASDAPARSTGLTVLLTLAQVGAFVALMLVAGRRLFPWLLWHVAKTGSRELFTLCVVAAAVSIAYGAAELFGVSFALGAFFAGVILSESELAHQAGNDSLPLKDAFAVLFFVSVGMLLRPSALLAYPAFTVTALTIVIVCNPLTAAAVAWLMGYPIRTTATVAMSLGQIGEFSFILVTLGRDLAIVPAEAVDVVVATAIISITLNPLAFRTIDPLAHWLGRVTLLRRDDAVNPDTGASSSLDPEGRAIVIGHGPTGRTVTRLLLENGISPTVVELNMSVVRELRDQGVSAVYGDAGRAETLVSAGLRHAATLIVSGADTGSPGIIQSARSINPTAHIFVRSPYLRDVPSLRRAGAERIFSGEGEVALAMTEAVLRRLGATPDQIDRERARVRQELMPSDHGDGGQAP
jgi:CPA2 family monovalent cation:H+ antiporter-2